MTIVPPVERRKQHPFCCHSVRDGFLYISTDIPPNRTSFQTAHIEMEWKQLFPDYFFNRISLVALRSAEQYHIFTNP